MSAVAATRRWGMAIDLDRCVGCQTCAVACKHANDTPLGIQWRRVLDVELGKFPDVARLFLPVGCQHCDDPPCVPVCPSGATRRRADGIVTQDYDLCIGCGYCAVSCPYGARSIDHAPRGYFGAALTRQEGAVAHDERRGVAQKCTFCVERIDRGLARGLVPGVDPEATPACAAACIAGAMTFGDLADPASPVARLLAANPGTVLNGPLGAGPNLRYFTRAPSADIALAMPATSPLTGRRQRRWDIRAVANFGLGGSGSGLAAVASAFGLFGLLDRSAILLLHLLAAGLIAAGLTAVWFEIGRMERLLNALRRPRSSWMSREMYVVGALFAALGAEWLWPGPESTGLVGLLALAFLYCQARILTAAKGIPAWRPRAMRWLLLASGLAEGCGWLALGNALLPFAPDLTAPLGLAMILAAAALATLWPIYWREAVAGGLGDGAKREIAGLMPAMLGIGQVLPAMLAAGALLASGLVALALSGIAGAILVVGGLCWKYAVIVDASHVQDLILPQVPRRGSGRLAALPSEPVEVRPS